MKNLLYLAFVAIFFVACESKNDLSDPNLVAENFLKSYLTMDYDGAAKFASEEFKSELERFESEKGAYTQDVIEEHKSSVATIKGMDLKEAEGTAVVKYSNSILPDVVDQLEMKKIEDNWYVHVVKDRVDMELNEKFSKEEIEKMMEEAEEEEEAMPINEEVIAE